MGKKGEAPKGVEVGKRVKVVSGEHADKTGVLKHIRKATTQATVELADGKSIVIDSSHLAAA